MIPESRSCDTIVYGLQNVNLWMIDTCANFTPSLAYRVQLLLHTAYLERIKSVPGRDNTYK